MRIIAGLAKGRPLRAVQGDQTRPTTDKVKEAIFSMIGPYFDGGLALDLFAGCGGLGLEAVSRGASKALFVEKDAAAMKVIKQNIQATQFPSDATQTYLLDAFRALPMLQSFNLQFSLVFLDPPYRMTNMDDVILELARRNLVSNDAVIVVEHDAKHRYAERIGPFLIWKHATYKDTAVTIYVVEQMELERGAPT